MKLWVKETAKLTVFETADKMYDVKNSDKTHTNVWE
jgi:hypothetical protein